MDLLGGITAVFDKIKWTYTQFKLKYLVPFVILLLYTLVGAFVFQWCERRTDEEIRETFRNWTVRAYDQMHRRMQEIMCHDPLIINDTSLQDTHTREAINWFLKNLSLVQVIEERTESSPWTMSGSMFYAGTLYSTIGYGRPSTKTTAGQFATIVYIMFGIPLFLTTLKEVGKHLSRLLRKLYKKWIKWRQHIPSTPAPIRRYSMAMQKQLHISLPSSRQSSIRRKKKKKEAEERNLDNIELGLTDHDDVEAEDDEDELSSEGADVQKNAVSFPDEMERHLPTLHEQFGTKAADLRRGTPFPISLALFILIVWICMSAALFCIWEEEWGYFMSVYFFFVSISTVGLGDVIPNNQDMMLANFILILIGLALLSMCINLIQRWIEHLLDDMLQQFVEEFEKIAAVVAEEEEEVKPFEIGISGTLAAAPLASIGQDNKTWNVADSAKNWFADRLASNLVKNHVHGSRNSLSSSSEGSDWEEDKVEGQTPDSSRRASIRVNAKVRPKRRKSHHTNIAAMRAMQLMSKSTVGGGGFKNQLLSKMIASDKMHLLESTIRHKTNIRYASVQTDNEFTELLNFLAIPKNERAENGSIAGQLSYHTALERLSSDDSRSLHMRSPTINFMELFTDSGIADATDSAVTTPHASMVQSMIDDSQPAHQLNRWLGMQVCSKCGHVTRDGRVLLDRATNPRNSRSTSPADDGKHVSFKMPEDARSMSSEDELHSVYVQSNVTPPDPEMIADPITEYRLAVDERHIGHLPNGFRTGSSPVDDDHFQDALDWSSIDIDDRASLLPTRSSPIDLVAGGQFDTKRLSPSRSLSVSSSRSSLNVDEDKGMLRLSPTIISLVDELIDIVVDSCDFDDRMAKGTPSHLHLSLTDLPTISLSSESEAPDMSEEASVSQEPTPSESLLRVPSVVVHLAKVLADEAVAQVSDLPKFVGR